VFARSHIFIWRIALNERSHDTEVRGVVQNYLTVTRCTSEQPFFAEGIGLKISAMVQKQKVDVIFFFATMLYESSCSLSWSLSIKAFVIIKLFLKNLFQTLTIAKFLLYCLVLTKEIGSC